MPDDPAVKQLREAIRQRRQRPPAERFRDMVRRGVIDASGRVLLTGPPAPEVSAKPGSNGSAG